MNKKPGDYACCGFILKILFMLIDNLAETQIFYQLRFM